MTPPVEEKGVGEKDRNMSEKVAALIAAARKFDALYQPDAVGHMADSQPDGQGIYGVNGVAITLGDLRRLRAALVAVEDVA